MSDGSTRTARVLTIDEVADHLKTSVRTIYRLLKTRKFPGFKVGSGWRFTIEQVERWESEKQIQTRSKESHQ
jgi:excisionase family DNA binding protein